MTYPSSENTALANASALVLAVDCPNEFVEQLHHRLNRIAIQYHPISKQDISYWLNSGQPIGSVIIGSPIELNEIEQTAELLCQLEQKSIPSFFLYPLPDALLTFPLAFSIDTSYPELWTTRLETAILLNQNYQKKTATLYLESDTAKQLELAGQLQRNFLPSRLPDTDQIRWAAMWRPAQWVSGDIYDISRLDEQHIGFYLADAVGHSMPAALLTIFIKQAAVMRQTQDNQYRIFEPAETLARLNRRMAQQEFAGCIFATCACGLLNIKTLEIKWARAGHPYPILIRDGKPESLPSRGGLLGVFEHTPIEQKSLFLQKDDKFLLYSDGLEPLIGKSTDDGAFEFLPDFQNVCRESIQAIIGYLEQQASRHIFGAAELDDLTAVGLQIH